MTGFYGRTDTATCCAGAVQASLCATTTCTLANTLGYLQASCNSKNSILAGLGVVLSGAGDPCANIIKYLIITYVCK